MNNDKEKSNKSIRWSDETHEKNKERAKMKGMAFDEYQNYLLSLDERVSLESSPIFGSQIGVVNELLVKLGEKFASLVSHAEDKIEIEVRKLNALRERTDKQITDLENQVKSLHSAMDDYERRALEAEERAVAESMACEKMEKDYEERILALNNSLSDKDSIINDKNEKIADKNEQIDGLNKKIESMEQAVSRTEEYKETIRIQDEEIIKLKDKYEKDLAAKDFEKERAIFEERQKITEKLNNKMNEQLREEIRRAEEARYKFEEKLMKKYDEDTYKIQKQSNEQLKESNDKIKSVLNENEVLQKQIEALNKKNADLEKQLKNNNR